jgi:hypothetical protein
MKKPNIMVLSEIAVLLGITVGLDRLLTPHAKDTTLQAYAAERKKAELNGWTLYEGYLRAAQEDLQKLQSIAWILKFAFTLFKLKKVHYRQLQKLQIEQESN